MTVPDILGLFYSLKSARIHSLRQENLPTYPLTTFTSSVRQGDRGLFALTFIYLSFSKYFSVSWFLAAQ